MLPQALLGLMGSEFTGMVPRFSKRPGNLADRWVRVPCAGISQGRRAHGKCCFYWIRPVTWMPGERLIEAILYVSPLIFYLNVLKIHFSWVYWSSCDQSSEDLEEGASLSSLFLICPTDTGVSCSHQAHTMVPALR